MPDAGRWGIRLDFTMGFVINLDINVEITARYGHLLEDIKATSTLNLEIGPVGVGGSAGPVLIFDEAEDPTIISLAPVEIGETLELGPGFEFGQGFNRRTGELEVMYAGFAAGGSAAIGYSDAVGLTVDYGALFEGIFELFR